MSDWTSGYVADIGYTYGYYHELNPLRLKLPLINSGLVPPEVNYACELGFGQGLSIAAHATAAPVCWYGTDFNPAQAGFAQDCVASSGVKADLSDQAFLDFCDRKDLPEFEFIGLHGIWSWVSDENRKVIVDFVRRKLKVGGVLYISYNTQPGWSAMLPMRELLNQHVDVFGAPGHGIVSRIDSSLEFAERLLVTNPMYAQVNSQVAERIKRMKGQNRSYLAHEYFNRDWHPMSFNKMAEWLAPAKLAFACSAHYLDHVDAANLSPEQLEFMNEIPDPVFRQSVRDFMCNTQFRRDYWVKGTRQLDLIERSELLRAQRVILTKPIDEIERKVAGVRGDATLNHEVYDPILNMIADHKPKSMAQLEGALGKKNITFSQIVQAILVLIGKGDVASVQDDVFIGKMKRHTDRLNQFFMSKSRGSTDFSYLVSPVTGGCIEANRFEQLFLLARAHGYKQPEEWARFAWEHLDFLSQRITVNGEAIVSAESNIAELERRAKKFNQLQLPVLKSLQVA